MKIITASPQLFAWYFLESTFTPLVAALTTQLATPFTPSDGSFTVNVATQTNCPVNVFGAITTISYGANDNITITVSKNPSYVGRSGSLNIANNSFIVQQQGDPSLTPPCNYLITPASEQSFGSSGGNITVN